MLKRLYLFSIMVFIVLSIAPKMRAVPVDDRYIAGYATAVVEREFNLRPYSLSVKDGVITISVQDIPSTISDDMIKVLEGIPGVLRVDVVRVTTGSTAPSTAAVSRKPESQEEGFLPKGELFAPLLADPRSPHFSAAYLRFTDQKDFDNVGSVSFGKDFALYRGDLPARGQWELDIEAAVFSIFDLDAASHDLINTDFWVAFPSVSYREGSFSALGRLFHQSSHLGDEFVLRDRVERVNLSYEGLNMKLSYDFCKDAFRLYGGGGYLFHTDPPDLQPWSTQLGLELESPRKFLNEMLRPVAAIDLQHRQETDWDPDFSLRTGVRFETQKAFPGRYQLMLEYYNGHSPHGQFYSGKIEYIGIGTHIYY